MQSSYDQSDNNYGVRLIKRAEVAQLREQAIAAIKKARQIKQINFNREQTRANKIHYSLDSKSSK